VPEENFWTLWCKGRLTEADTLTIRLGTTPSGLTSAHLHHAPIFLQAGCPSCCSTISVKALKANQTPVVVVIYTLTRMWANAKRNGCPAEYRWRRLFNAAKFG